MSNSEVGSRIRDARCLKIMSQAQLAGAIGCSAPHVSQIKNGETSARVCQLVLAARCLGVDSRWLMTGIASEQLALAVTLSPKAQDLGAIAHTKEMTELVAHFLGKPLQQRRKVLAAWKAVLEMA